MDVIKEYQAFVEKKGDALSRYLGRAELRLLEKLRYQLFKNDGVELSLSQFHCLQFLCLRGISQRELASRMGITKQAMNQAVSDLEKKGLVYKEADTNDGRVKIIRHTNKGKKVVAKIIKITMQVENEIIHKIGERNFKILKNSLSIIEEMP